MAEARGLTAPQREAVVALLRAMSDAELQLEENRCRLCEPSTFDPHSLFESLQGPAMAGRRGWVNAHDVRDWLLARAGYSQVPSVEDIAMVLPAGASGTVTIEHFFALVLPQCPANECSKRLALGRAVVGEPSLEVARRFSQLIEGEIESQHRLRFHRKTMRDLGIPQDAVLRFLDSEQGACAGMGGLLEPAGVMALLCDRLGALSRTQAAALFRRAHIGSSSFFSFEEFAKQLWPAMPPISAVLPSSVVGLSDSWRASQAQEALGSPSRQPPSTPVRHSPPTWASPGAHDFSSPDATRKSCLRNGPEASPDWINASTRLPADSPLSHSSPMRSSFDAPVASPGRSWLEPVATGSPMGSPARRAAAQAAAAAAEARAIAWASSPARLRDVGGSPALPAAKSPSALRSPSAGRVDAGRGSPGLGMSSFDAGRGRSPSPNRYARDLGASATHVSLGVSSPPWAGGWASGSPSLSPQPLARSSSLPPGSRSTAPWALPPSVPSPSASWQKDVQERLTKAVLQHMSRQAELDSELEDAKSLLPHACLEAAFSALTRGSYITAGDVAGLAQDFGYIVTKADFCNILREVRLRWSWDDPAASALLIYDRLSFRDLALLVCPVDSPEYVAVRDAKSDDEARSALYLLKYSEPCPTCGARVQRDADAAGCPTVTCPVCRTSFRCFCVVGDHSSCLGPPPLTVSGCNQLARLLRSSAYAANEMEQDRKKLALMLTYDGYSLSDIFGRLAGSQAALCQDDLRNVFFSYGLGLTHRAAGLLWRRYSQWQAAGIGGISLPDFRRQLHPSASAGSP